MKMPRTEPTKWAPSTSGSGMKASIRSRRVSAGGVTPENTSMAPSTMARVPSMIGAMPDTAASIAGLAIVALRASLTIIAATATTSGTT